MKAKHIVRMGLLTAALIAAKECLAFLPNIEIVTLLIMIYTLTIGRKVIYIIVVFVLSEMFLYGMSSWVIMYLYIWPLLAFLTWKCRKNEGLLFWAALSGAFGLFFGGLCSLTYLVLAGPAGAFSYWIMGIPFDLIHCGSNFILTAVLFQPLRTVFQKLEQK